MTILVPPYVTADGGPRLVEVLRDRRSPLDVMYAEDDAAMLEVAPDVEIVVTSRLPDDLLEAAPELEWVQALSAGTDFYDYPVLEERGVMLTSVSGVHAKPIGQQVLAYLLFFERRFDRAVAQQARREWDPYFARELGDRTIGIVGVGAIGSQVAEYCDSFGATVLGVKRDPSEAPAAVDEIYGPSRLGAVLKASEYLVLSCPLTDETRGMIDADALAALPDDAVLVNVGRGEVVDQDALVAALENGTLGGAALDVFEDEPLPDESPLWGRDDVLITPHMAGSTPHYWERAADIFLDNLDRYRAGEALRNRVL